MKRLSPEEREAYLAWTRELDRRYDEDSKATKQALAEWRAEIERRRDARRLFGFIWTR